MANYRVRRVLGRGSMGEVFEAEHVLLGRRAAVKVLLPELSAMPEAVGRFFVEARAAACMKHVGLVEVHDFGYHASGRAFIVMELLEGPTLAQLVEQRGRLPVAEALALARQIAVAMAAAHAAGVVHRDLKPENIVLVGDPEAPGGVRVKVCDFGIAKLADSCRFSDGPMATRDGQIMGTPAFMAPEQCHGAHLVDERADIYALGCVLYHMLTGRPPFVSDGVGATMAAHLYEEPWRPGELVASIPRLVDGLVMQLLAKSPGDRPASMDAVDAAIAAVTDALAGRERSFAVEPAMATATQPMEGRPARPRAGWLAGVATVVGMAVAGFAAWQAPGLHELLDAPAPVMAAEVTAPARIAMAEAPAAAPTAAIEAPEPGVGEPARITVNVTSRPDGAEVLRAADGTRLGVTPLQLELPARGGRLALELRKRGYRSEAVELATDRDGQAQVILEKRRRERRVYASSLPTHAEASALVIPRASARPTPTAAVTAPPPVPPVAVKDGALDPFAE